MRKKRHTSFFCCPSVCPEPVLAANHYVFDPEPEILTQHRCCAGKHYCVATNLSTAQQLELQDRLFADMNAWESLTADGQAVRPQQQQNLLLVCAVFLQIRDLSFDKPGSGQASSDIVE